MDIEERVQDWEFWCPHCRNRSFELINEAPKTPDTKADNGDDQHIFVRTIRCSRPACHRPMVVCTATYFNPQQGWGARGVVGGRGLVAGRIPLEYLIFQYPTDSTPLPKSIPPEVKESFDEAEFALGNGKLISAGALIRNTVRLLTESEEISKKSLKEAVKELKAPAEYKNALTNLKIVGDDSLHFEKYSRSELVTALNVLAAVLAQIYSERENLQVLHKVVSDKASRKASGKKA